MKKLIEPVHKVLETLDKRVGGYLVSLTRLLRIRSNQYFTFCGETYEFFWHLYNWTWSNERCVEVPLIWRLIQQHPSQSVLEVGNVLSHYFPVAHDIIDKYERGPHVLNVDATEFHPNKRYALIASISTLEHIGIDEVPYEPAKVLKAIHNLRGLLGPNGKLVFTALQGHNPTLDHVACQRWVFKRPKGLTVGVIQK